MNILITGSNGQLGHDCCELLAPQHDIHSFPSARLDITRQDQVHSTLQAVRPEVVINCAAYTAVDNCEKNSRRCTEVNAQGPALLADECSRLDCRLIHVSTDYVFNGRKPVPAPYTEDDATDPLSAYGRSKLAGEEGIRSRLDNHLIVRTAWLYGIQGGNFLKTMLHLALSDPQRTIRVVDDQYGSLTWSCRLAEQIFHLLDQDLTGTVHATAEGCCTWYEGARCFLEAMNIPHSLQPCESSEYPTPAHRPCNSILENRRLQESGLNIMQPWDRDVILYAETFRDTLLAEADR